MPEHDTIFALSSGRPPVAIAVIRISGPRAGAALTALGVKIPAPRQAGLARIRDPRSGEIIDEALVLWFPGPHSETGEDVAELQAHGGRAVIAAILDALAHIEGLRMAEGGEFTRRGFENGKLDLTAVEGLADLVGAETEAQRRQAFRQMKGLLGNRAETWRHDLIKALALVEARIDFSDEADVPEDLVTPALTTARALRDEIAAALADGGRGERLREGLVVAIAGPPNAGKSTLLNRIARREAAIVSPYAGTTRDVIEVHLDLGGLPVTLLDTAGIRDTDDPVEMEGVRRARERAAGADLVLWVVDASTEAAGGALAAGRPLADGTQSGGEVSAAAVGLEGTLSDGSAMPAAQPVPGGTGAGLEGTTNARPSLRGDRGAQVDGSGGDSSLGAGGGDRANSECAAKDERSSSPFARLVGGQTGGSGLRIGGGDIFGSEAARPVPARPAVWRIHNKIDLLPEQKTPTEQSVNRNESGSLLYHKNESELESNKFLTDIVSSSLKNKSESRFAGQTQSTAVPANDGYNNEQEIHHCEYEFNLSASSGQGFESLLAGLTHYAENHLSGAEQAIVTRARHRLVLEQALAALDRALAPGLGEDLLAEELRAAAHALGRLTGRIDVEDILDVIFRDFCIGK